MSQVKTVKIKDGDDYQVINASDFNPSIHELCDGEGLDGAFKANLIPGEPADLNGLVSTEQFDVVAQKLTETEDQLNKEREAVKKLTTEKDALLAQVKELEAKPKKPTAAELKAAKAAEETATTELPKE